MPIELKIKSEDLSNDDMVNVFRLFCKAFEIKSNKINDEFFKTRALEVMKKFGLDYRPYMGAKFFGKEYTNSIIFHGYSQQQDPNYNLKDKKFQDLVKDYFNKKFKGYPTNFTLKLEQFGVYTSPRGNIKERFDELLEHAKRNNIPLENIVELEGCPETDEIDYIFLMDVEKNYVNEIVFKTTT
ncbi:MAG: hypothetical protein AABW45_00745 [Nanoarchaeota archaeon]